MRRFIRLFNDVELSYFKFKEALVIAHFISKVQKQLITMPFILAKCQMMRLSHNHKITKPLSLDIYLRL